MPVYHFTYHAYGTWLPDHRRGYTRKGAQVVAPDQRMADRYRANMKHKPATFTAAIQRAMLDELQIACQRQGFTLNSIAMDATHLHIVVAWTSTRNWKRVRAGIQSSLTRRLNADFARRPWFVAHPSRKRVRDRKHLGYLQSTYHPSHNGLKWNRQRGAYR